MIRTLSKNPVQIVCAVVISFTAVTVMSSASYGAEYPPSIQQPLAGEPIQAPVPPKTSGATPVVPIAVSSNIPAVTTPPVSVSSVVRSTNAVQSNTVFDKKPVAPAKDVIVGGIPTSKKDDLPYTTISAASSRKVEVQVAEDVPTTLFVSRLTPRANAQVIITVNGRAITLGTFRVGSDGALEIPPLTLGREGLSIQVQVRSGKVTRSFTVRSTN